MTAHELMSMRRRLRATDDDIEKSEDRREQQRCEQAQYELACENEEREE